MSAPLSSPPDRHTLQPLGRLTSGPPCSMELPGIDLSNVKHKRFVKKEEEDEDDFAQPSTGSKGATAEGWDDHEFQDDEDREEFDLGCDAVEIAMNPMSEEDTPASVSPQVDRMKAAKANAKQKEAEEDKKGAADEKEGGQNFMEAGMSMVKPPVEYRRSEGLNAFLAEEPAEVEGMGDLEKWSNIIYIRWQAARWAYLLYLRPTHMTPVHATRAAGSWKVIGCVRL
jgi:hypothetical protein